MKCENEILDKYDEIEKSLNNAIKEDRVVKQRYYFGVKYGLSLYIAYSSKLDEKLRIIRKIDNGILRDRMMDICTCPFSKGCENAIMWMKSEIGELN